MLRGPAERGGEIPSKSGVPDPDRGREKLSVVPQPRWVPGQSPRVPRLSCFCDGAWLARRGEDAVGRGFHQTPMEILGAFQGSGIIIRDQDQL